MAYQFGPELRRACGAAIASEASLNIERALLLEKSANCGFLFLVQAIKRAAVDGFRGHELAGDQFRQRILDKRECLHNSLLQNPPLGDPFHRVFRLWMLEQVSEYLAH